MSYCYRGTGIIAFVAALFLVLPGCSDSPVSPSGVEAAQAQDAPQQRSLERTRMGERELLLAVLARLDSIESRFDRERAILIARVDSIAVGATELLAAGMSNDFHQLGVGPPKNGGGNSMAATIELINQRTDSIMELNDWIARDMSRVWLGTQICGGLEVKGLAEFKQRTEARAEGKAGLGINPWDTGAAAQVHMGQRYMLELGLEGELGVGAEACVNLNNILADPPVRTTSSTASMARASGDARLMDFLLSLQGGHLNLSQDRIAQAVEAGTSILQEGNVARFGELATALPMPPALQDPVGFARGRLSSFDPVGFLCGGTGFGESRIASRVSDACGFIHANDLPDLGSYLNLASNFNDLENRFTTLCGRFNSVVMRRLVVDSNLPWDGGSLNVGLFPSAWRVVCEATAT